MSPLRVFTFRGWALLGAGLAIGGAGLVIGERHLVAMGLLALLLPLLSGLLVAASASAYGTPERVTHSRALQPPRVPAGGDVRVLVRVANASGSLPVGGLLVEDSLPLPLGEEPRFAIGLLRAGAVRDLTYRVRAEVRGSYPIGPLRMSFTDPLGCARVRRASGAGTPLLVTPPVVPLAATPGGGDTAGAGGIAAHPSAGSGEDDPVPREYRHGDDLRRVHWRSTARHGELMVRREERQWSDTSVVLLDLRAAAHAGTGAESSLETAVSAAGSVAVHLAGRGQRVSLHSDESGQRPVDGGSERTLLDALAVARPSRGTLLGSELLEHAPVTGRGLLVAVLGALRPEETDSLARAGAAHEQRRVAVLCRTAAWPSPDALRHAHTTLTQSGWQVTEITTLRDLPAAWQHLPTLLTQHGGTP